MASAPGSFGALWGTQAGGFNATIEVIAGHVFWTTIGNTGR
ncbi:MAG TPA: hypothetical protein VI029_21075 [Mycobacterium sp.]